MKKWWFVAVTTALFLMPIVAIGVLGRWNSFKVSELPILSHLPPFELTANNGKNLALSDLAGKVWIGSFIFTHCGGQCPLIAERVRKLQHDLQHKTEVRFLSFTVDPEHDSPKVLDAYAKKFDANPLKWFFVTGEKATIQKVVQDGFKMMMGDGTDGAEQVMHSFKLALVDPWGRVRGYYDANDDNEMKKLAKDTRRLIRQSF